MTRRVIHPIALVAALAALALPATSVASPASVVQDCADDGSLSGRHSNADKRAALGQIPADLDEYSDCRAVISSSIGNGVGKAATANSTAAAGEDAADGKATGPARGADERLSPAQKRERAKVARQIASAERTVGPRTAGVLEASDTANGMPLPVLLALVALGLLGAGAGLFVLGKRKPGFAGALSRGRFPRSRR